MDASETTTRRATVRFTGQNAVFRRLVVRGALLELVTFGFYRFWLATDMRRHLWSNTEIDGDAVEYTGRAKELLLGFLVALAILAPVFVAYFLVGIAAERVKAFLSLPLYAFLFMFGQFAVFRARRYRLTRTVWRGVRFWMTGSGWSYAWRALLWLMLAIVTLGFAYPFGMAALERYKMSRTHYGTLPGRFEATGGQLFRRVWWVWLLGLLPPLLLFGGSVAAGVAAARAHGNPASPGSIGAGLAILVGLLSMIALPFLHAVRKAIEWKWWADGIRFGALSVASDLPPSGLIGVYWAMIGVGLLIWAAFGTAFGAIAGAVAVAIGHPGNLTGAIGRMPAWSVAAFGVWYLALLLAFGIVARIYTLQRVWKRVVDSCAVADIDAAANVGAAGELASAIGEGLADGLDFAGF